MLAKSIDQGIAYSQTFTENPKACPAPNLELDTQQMQYHAIERQLFSPASALEPGNSPQKGLFGSDYAQVSFCMSRFGEDT